MKYALLKSITWFDYLGNRKNQKTIIKKKFRNIKLQATYSSSIFETSFFKLLQWHVGTSKTFSHIYFCQFKVECLFGNVSTPVYRNFTNNSYGFTMLIDH